MKYIHIRLNELMEENGISKNRICKDLDQQRGNFNRRTEKNVVTQRFER